MLHREAPLEREMGLILLFLPTTPLQVQAQPLVSCRDGSAPVTQTEHRIPLGRAVLTTRGTLRAIYVPLKSRKTLFCFTPLHGVFVFMFDTRCKAGAIGPAPAGRMEERGSIPAGAASGDAKLGFAQGPAAGTGRTRRGFVHGDLLTSTGHFTEKRPWLHTGRVFTLP